MQRSTDFHRAVQIGERERHALGRHVHVALVRPGSAERGRAGRAAPRGRPARGALAAHCAATRSSIALAASSAIDRIAQRGSVPTRAAAQVEPRRAGRERVRRTARATPAPAVSGARPSRRRSPRTRRRCGGPRPGRMADMTLYRQPARDHRDRRRRRNRVRASGRAGGAPIDCAVGRRDRRGVLRRRARARARLVGRRRVHERRALRAAVASRLERRHGATSAARPRAARARSTRCSGRVRSKTRRSPTTTWSAPRRRSTSCTSASGPTAIPRRCFPGARRSTKRERFVVAAGDSLHPHPASDLHVSRRSPARGSRWSRSRGRRSATRSSASGPVRTFPAARIRAERVLWLGDRAAMGAQ